MSTNIHHTLWIARQYQRTGREPLRLRDHYAMKHVMDIRDHNALHHEIQPLPVISRALAASALDFLPRVETKPQQESFTALIEHFACLSNGIGKMAIESGMFAEHFEEQLRFM